MIRKRTVFVVGAGASAEFGLPVGSALQVQIAQLLSFRFTHREMTSGDEQILRIIRQKSQDEQNAYQQAARLIREGVVLSNSIDNFMDVHRHDACVAALGRLGIAKGIAEAERTSKLYIDPSNSYNEMRFSALRETWVARLFGFLQEGRTLSEVRLLFENASFIIFNYDRCVEHYFVKAIEKMYAVDEAAAVGIVMGAQIAHPYGTIGSLPWMRARSGASVEFGAPSLPLEAMAAGIGTYTQRIDDADSLHRIRSTVAEADLICFLGFSYQPQNMDIIRPTAPSKVQTIIGTAYETSQFDKGMIEGELRAFPTVNPIRQIHLEDMKCADLIAQFSRAFR